MKNHKFAKRMHAIWTMLMLVSWIMCIISGHQMARERKNEVISIKK